MMKMKNISTIVFLFVIVIFLVSCNNKQLPNKAIVSQNSLIDAEKIEEKIVDKKAEKIPNFYAEFKLDPNTVKEIKGEKYSYYTQKSNLEILSAVFHLENTHHDANVTLVAMQGREITPIRTKNLDTWSNTLQFSSELGDIKEIEIEINWNPEGSEELMIFPYIDGFGDFYSGQHATLIRLFIGKNSEYEFNPDEMKSKIGTNITNDTKIIPTLDWIDENNNKIPIVVDDNGKAYLTSKTNRLRISSISYSTEIDLIYFNDSGEYHILQSDYKLNKDEAISLEIDNKILDEYVYRNTDSHHFILAVNNKEIEMLKDYYAANKDYQPVSTNFNQIIEIYKLKE